MSTRLPAGMIRWQKRGIVPLPLGTAPWMMTHAANPTAVHAGGDVYRVYFGSRDALNRTHIAYADIEFGDTARVHELGAEPLLGPGEPGTFDDSGTSVGCVVRDGERTLLFYLGWNVLRTVPFGNAIGLATSEGGTGRFTRVSPGPIMGRDAVDPLSLSYPWVLREGPRWRMWYGSLLRWIDSGPQMEAVIKYAESDDGVTWRRGGHVAIGLDPPSQTMIARPCVLPYDGGYRMWYSYRGAAYRIGYAESPDGLTWTRMPGLATLDPSPTGWDSEEVAYATVFEQGSRLVMLYNGNGYGRDGFGWAVAE